MTTGVWFGNDDGTSMKKVTGGGLPARAWNEYMTAAHAGYSPTPLFGSYGRFELPPAAVEQETGPATIGDIISGVLPGFGGQDSYPPPPVADRNDIVPPGHLPVRAYHELLGPQPGDRKNAGQVKMG